MNVSNASNRQIPNAPNNSRASQNQSANFQSAVGNLPYIAFVDENDERNYSVAQNINSQNPPQQQHQQIQVINNDARGSEVNPQNNNDNCNRISDFICRAVIGIFGIGFLIARCYVKICGQENPPGWCSKQ